MSTSETRLIDLRSLAILQRFGQTLRVLRRVHGLCLRQDTGLAAALATRAVRVRTVALALNRRHLAAVGDTHRPRAGRPGWGVAGLEIIEQGGGRLLASDGVGGAVGSHEDQQCFE